jgi:hypothetical protein
VHFVQRRTNEAIVNYKKERSTIDVKVGNVTNILNEVDATSWWIGRVQAMWRRNGKMFRVLRHVVDLLAQTEELGRRILTISTSK